MTLQIPRFVPFWCEFSPTDDNCDHPVTNERLFHTHSTTRLKTTHLPPPTTCLGNNLLAGNLNVPNPHHAPHPTN